jgi:hypothetical protein
VGKALLKHAGQRPRVPADLRKRHDLRFDGLRSPKLGLFFWVSPAAAIRDAIFAVKVCYLRVGQIGSKG